LVAAPKGVTVPKGLETIIQIVLAVLGAYVAAFWFALVVWTFRDIQKRSRDVLVQVLATVLVLFFSVPGLVLYTILRPPETLAETYARSLEEESLLQDIEDRQSCPSCKRRVQPDYLLCPSCRTQLKQVCLNCSRLLHLSWRVCPYCGKETTADDLRVLAKGN
jgi:RNA polymerase subunit RPABC4/transcription elongation factor Spt4